jgi:diguanylate cyclase (GGDEF)-like protein
MTAHSDPSQHSFQFSHTVNLPTHSSTTEPSSVAREPGAVPFSEAAAEILHNARTALKESCLAIVADLPASARAVVLREVMNELLTDQWKELMQQYAELEQSALYDTLTGALNRQGFLRRGEQLLAESASCVNGAALVYLDADNLKRLNDQHGHDAGDQALKESVALIHKRTRRSDLVARFGGDEFVILLTQCNEPTACAIVHRIISECAVRDSSVTSPRLSFSAGMVWCPPGNTNVSLTSLIAMADERLYKAKHAGRAQMCAA